MSLAVETGTANDAQVAAALAKLKRASGLAGALVIGGGVVALAALGLSGYQVAALQTQKGQLETRIGTLREQEAALIKRNAGLSRSALAEEDRRELARAQIVQGNSKAAEQILEAPSLAVSTGLAAPSRTDTPRVYFQIRSRDQIARYQACAAALRPQGYRVAYYELVSAGPTRSQVRYFHAEEEAQATALAEVARQCLGGEVSLVRLQYPNVNPLHFEVWVAPS